MNEQEDEPEDVQNATPVEEEIRASEIDEISSKKVEAWSRSTRHRCRSDKPVAEKIDCCEAKRRKLADKHKSVKVYRFDKPCELEKPEIIPRQCLTKEEYLDFLATPKKKCPSQCTKKPSMRRLRAITQRGEELALPAKRKLVRALDEWGAILPVEKVDYLIELVEGQTALTPEQAENFMRDKANARVIHKSKKKKRSRVNDKCPPPARKPRKTLGNCEQPGLDEEAVNCQYSMAQRLVRSILNWQCEIPRCEYRDIADVVLARLSDVLGYAPTGAEDRRSQQMRLLADVLACWMAGVLVEVSEHNREELEQECLRRQREAEERAQREELEALQAARDADDEDDDDADQDGPCLDDDDDDADQCDADDDDDEDDAAASLAVSEVPELARSAVDASLVSLSMLETSTQYEQLDASGPIDLAGMSCAEIKELEGCDEDEECALVLQECLDAEQQTEQLVCDEPEVCDEPPPAVKSREQQELEQMASRLSATLESDVPFVTFAKIFETLYCMIECEAENCLEDPVDNRIQRAIYEKFEQAVRCEDAGLMTARLQDLLDVCSGKLAKWLRKALTERQVCFLLENPAQVESREMRQWSRRIAEASRVVDHWSGWISQVTDEALNMRCKRDAVTRAGWQSFTGKLEGNAMRYRKAYLDILHEGHHDVMMLTGRKPVKTGRRTKLPPYVEQTINSTNLESCSTATRK